MIKKIAFTLAEVLITLGIIGIVAEMTIPTLMQSFQKQVNTTALRKGYSEFNQALANLTNDMGCTGDLACTNLLNTVDATIFGNQMVTYLRTVKNCSTGGGCFSTKMHSYYNASDAAFDYYTIYPAAYVFTTADNISYAIRVYGNCDFDYSKYVTNNMKKVCGEVLMDVNGPNFNPDYEGIDIFEFYLTTGKGPMLYPKGGADDNLAYWKTNGCITSNKIGWYCAARIMEEGWQINY